MEVNLDAIPEAVLVKPRCHWYEALWNLPRPSPEEQEAPLSLAERLRSAHAERRVVSGFPRGAGHFSRFGALWRRYWQRGDARKLLERLVESKLTRATPSPKPDAEAGNFRQSDGIFFADGIVAAIQIDIEHGTIVAQT